MRLPNGWKKTPPLRLVPIGNVQPAIVFPELREYRHTSGARVIEHRGLGWNLYPPGAHEPTSCGMDGAALARTYNAAVVA